MSARRIRSWKRFDNRSANAAEPDPQLAGTGGRPKVSTRALAQVIERSSRIQARQHRRMWPACVAPTRGPAPPRS